MKIEKFKIFETLMNLLVNYSIDANDAYNIEGEVDEDFVTKTESLAKRLCNVINNDSSFEDEFNKEIAEIE